MHSVVDTSPMGWLLGSSFYKRNSLREVEGYIYGFKSQTLISANRYIKIPWVLWYESETPCKEVLA
jgi:hypothetical protein